MIKTNGFYSKWTTSVISPQVNVSRTTLFKDPTYCTMKDVKELVLLDTKHNTTPSKNKPNKINKVSYHTLSMLFTLQFEMLPAVDAAILNVIIF